MIRFKVLWNKIVRFRISFNGNFQFTFSVLCNQLGLLEGRFVAENASHKAHGKILVPALFHLFFSEWLLAFVPDVLVGSDSFLLNVGKVHQNVFEKIIPVGVTEPFDLKN